MADIEERIIKLEKILYSLKGGALVLTFIVLGFFGWTIYDIPKNVSDEVETVFDEKIGVGAIEHAKKKLEEIDGYRNTAAGHAEELSKWVSQNEPESALVLTGKMAITTDSKKPLYKSMQRFTENDATRIGTQDGRVNFKKSFSSKPEVFVALSYLDSKHNVNLRINVSVLSVDKKGFSYRMVTWANSFITYAEASWIAIGKE